MDGWVQKLKSYNNINESLDFAHQIVMLETGIPKTLEMFLVNRQKHE